MHDWAETLGSGVLVSPTLPMTFEEARAIINEWGDPLIEEYGLKCQRIAFAGEPYMRRPDGYD